LFSGGGWTVRISIPALLEPNAFRDLIATGRDAYSFLEGR
jgi:hypothetical protein